MPIQPNTEREEIIKLDGKIDILDSKVDYVVASLERAILALENLEKTKLSDHETRLLAVEKWVSEWKGVQTLMELQLYVSTAVLLITTVAVIIGVSKISSIKAAIHKRDVLYIKKFEALEQIINTDIKTILEILKNENHNVGKK